MTALEWPKKRVFIDTNAILPCVSIGGGGSGHYAVETVRTVVDETQRGDAGERDLLAHILAHEKPAPDILILTTSDRAAIRACCTLQWGDCLVSLERLLKDAGSPPKALAQLEGHDREAWLIQVRTGFRLGLVK